MRPLLLLCLLSSLAAAFQPALIPSRSTTTLSALVASDSELMEVGKRLKLEIFDLDEGVFGYESKDNKYGLEVVRVNLPTDGGLGLVLTELARGNDGRGLVLVSEVTGKAQKAMH